MILGYWLKGTVKKMNPPWVSAEKHPFLYDYFLRVSSRDGYIKAMSPVPDEEAKESSADFAALAVQYFELSNQHDLASIQTLFASDAVYESNGTGLHEGLDAIMRMKRVFFGDNPSVRWSIESPPRRSGQAVAINFTMSWEGKPDVQGLEVVTFDQAGQIVKVEVRRS